MMAGPPSALMIGLGAMPPPPPVERPSSNHRGPVHADEER